MTNGLSYTGCVDSQLLGVATVTLPIRGERREKNLRELRLNTNEVKALVKL